MTRMARPPRAHVHIILFLFYFISHSKSHVYSPNFCQTFDPTCKWRWENNNYMAKLTMWITYRKHQCMWTWSNMWIVTPSKKENDSQIGYLVTQHPCSWKFEGGCTCFFLSFFFKFFLRGLIFCISAITSMDLSHMVGEDFTFAMMWLIHI